MSDDLLDDEQSGPETLPQMLNVLTILTFIGSGLALLTNAWSFLTLSSSREKFEESMAQLDEMGGTGNSFTDSIMDGASAAIENGPTLYTIAIIVAILCILGALQMRKLKKTGYYIYVAACVAGIILPLVILGGSVLSGIAAIGGSIFSILFIILYGVNLKHLK